MIKLKYNTNIGGNYVQWEEIKKNMKNEIMENRPVAKLDADGNITLDVSD